MRKYYKPQNIRKRMLNHELDSKVNPWSLLRAYACGVSGYLSLDELSMILSCCNRESVKQYLEISSYFDDLTQEYDVSSSTERIFAHRQISCLLKKYPFKVSDLTTDPKQKAIEKWLSAEDQCKDTNERISALNGAYPSWFRQAREHCYRILGDLTPKLVMKMITQGQHGPGSTLSSQGNRVSAYYKFADTPYTCTDGARQYAYAAITSDLKWYDSLESSGRRKEIPPNGSPLFQKQIMLLNDVVEDGNSDKITFVPKDCRTDRPIAVGASLNLFLQLGVKTELEDKLKRFGIDLTDQTKNQRLAKAGSQFCMSGDQVNPNQFSTIDLASASDTISIELVKALLPSDWFAFLCDLRHETGSLNGDTVTYQKFSAMGNGFTFPLESLIFYCISYGAMVDSGFSCTRNDISVFGDDIIVRYKTTPAVLSALNWSGFSVNEEKSFLSGYFKESCGADYFNGTLVRPFYLKKEIRTYEEIYFSCNSFANKIISECCSTGLLLLYKEVIASVDKRLLNYGPMHYAKDLGEFSVSSGYLSVPLSHMNSQGLRPWLSHEEQHALYQAKLIKKDDLFLQSLFFINSYHSAVPYKARCDINYLLKLRSLGTNPRPCKWTDKGLPNLDLVESDTKTTYRRKATRLVIRVAPILNWDSFLTRYQLYEHPIWALQNEENSTLLK